MLVSPTGVKPDKGLHAKAVGYRVRAVERRPDAEVDRLYVEHDLGASITEGAAKLLQESVRTDLSQLKTELDKLSNFASASGGTINEAMVSAVVGVGRGLPGDFLDAVAPPRTRSPRSPMLPSSEQPRHRR